MTDTIENILKIFAEETLICSMGGIYFKGHMKVKHGWSDETIDEYVAIYRDNIHKVANSDYLYDKAIEYVQESYVDGSRKLPSMLLGDVAELIKITTGKEVDLDILEKYSENKDEIAKKLEGQDILLSNDSITYWLLSNGFNKYHGDMDFDCVKKVHDLHSIFWSNNLKHFSIGVLNESGKKEAGGGYKKWNLIVLPKPIYTIKQAKNLVESISL